MDRQGAILLCMVAGSKSPTWLEAAIEALDGQRALTVQEITARIASLGIRQLTGKTPEATVAANLYTAIERGDSLVRLAAPGRFERMSAAAAADATNAQDDSAASPGSVGASGNQAMSFLDAAERVLQLDADRQPMALADIVEIAIERGYVKTRGKTPAATLSAQIGTENRRRMERGELPRFTKPRHGHYGLTIWHGEGIVQAVSQHRQEMAEKLKERLRRLHPDEFEVFVARLLDAIGVEEAEPVGQPGDKGIDVRGVLVVAGVIRRPIAVQAKRWTTSAVGRPSVQQLRGGLGSHDIGLLVTVGTFSSGAISEARRGDAAPVALLDGDGIADLMLKHEIGVESTPLEVFELVDDNAGGGSAAVL